MKYLEKYLEEKMKIKVLGNLTLKCCNEGGFVGASVVIDGYEPGITVWYVDYAKFLEEEIELLNTRLAAEQTITFGMEMKLKPEDKLEDFLTDTVEAGMKRQDVELIPNEIDRREIKTKGSADMKLEDFKREVMTAMKNKPEQWRDGQFVFNYIEENYCGVGRYVQFIEGVDCYYDDKKIDEFISLCHYHLGTDINDINFNNITLNKYLSEI
jgi:hypothetical protein